MNTARQFIMLSPAAALSDRRSGELGSGSHRATTLTSRTSATRRSTSGLSDEVPSSHRETRSPPATPTRRANSCWVKPAALRARRRACPSGRGCRNIRQKAYSHRAAGQFEEMTWTPFICASETRRCHAGGDSASARRDPRASPRSHGDPSVSDGEIPGQAVSSPKGPRCLPAYRASPS